MLLPIWDSVIVLRFVVHYFVSILVLQSCWLGRQSKSWLLCFVCLPGVSCCCVALSNDATGLSAVCECGISWSYSSTIFGNGQYKIQSIIATNYSACKILLLEEIQHANVSALAKRLSLVNEMNVYINQNTNRCLWQQQRKMKQRFWYQLKMTIIAFLRHLTSEFILRYSKQKPNVRLKIKKLQQQNISFLPIFFNAQK